MNTLVPGMQKEQTAKHDQHNSLQISGPIPPTGSTKKEKIKHLFSHFMKDKSNKLKTEGFVINPKIYGQQTNTTAEPSNLPDVPLLHNNHLGTDSIKIDKNVLTHDKTNRSIKEKNGNLNKEHSVVNTKLYAQQTGAPTDGPISLPDVPFLDNNVELKPSRIVNNLDSPVVEVKMSTYRPLVSESMLPTLCDVEPKADIQSTVPKLAEKSSQVPNNVGEYL